MKAYIGIKFVDAEPMTVQEYNKQIRPLHYSGESQEGYKVVYEDGYVSWSPKNVFEKAYKLTSKITFGLAIEAVKLGHKAAREGWNGKNQYIELATNISYTNASAKIINAEHDAIGNKAIAFVGTSGVQLGWLASQADILAEDWAIVK
jgi:hypothetical protein